jgi:hypothetical protein
LNQAEPRQLASNGSIAVESNLGGHVAIVAKKLEMFLTLSFS